MNLSINSTIISEKAIIASPMDSKRRTALVAGIFYLLTFISIPTLSLYVSVHDADYVLSRGSDSKIFLGAILELLVALTGIGTAVTLYPILKKQNEGMALGLVASRVLEASTIFLGVAFLLSVVTLRQSGVGQEALSVSHALVALYDRVFLIGQSFMPAINDLLLGMLLYQTRLVPRALALIGIIGAIPLVAGDLFVLFGYIDQHSPYAGVSALMVAVFEFSLGVYLVFKGFKKL